MKFIKKIFARFINFNWANPKQLITFAKDIKAVAKNLLTIDTTKNRKDFKQSCKDLGITDADIKRKAAQFYLSAYFFLFLSVLTIIYGLINLYNGFVLTFIGSFGIAFALLGFAFRYHFWWFQLHHELLGCDFYTWYYKGLLGKK